MTRSDTKKKLALTCRAIAAAGLAGIVSIALAQDTSARYARLVIDATIIERYNSHIERQVVSQQAEIAALESQIALIDTTAVDLAPLLQRMFDELEQFVASDVPFFQGERTERIARLRDVMNQVDAQPAEKYRRLMEAYQIEMEYGRTMDAYRGALADGREAEFVRLGRVSLMYRATDGETAYWDNEQRTWVVEDDYETGIEEALGIATEQTAPDLIVVPIPVAQGARS